MRPGRACRQVRAHAGVVRPGATCDVCGRVSASSRRERAGSCRKCTGSGCEAASAPLTRSPCTRRKPRRLHEARRQRIARRLAFGLRRAVRHGAELQRRHPLDRPRRARRLRPSLPSNDRPIYYNGMINFIARYASKEASKYPVARFIVTAQSKKTRAAPTSTAASRWPTATPTTCAGSSSTRRAPTRCATRR